jgi:fructose-1,6-bisphosphatase
MPPRDQEKVDRVLAGEMSDAERAEFANAIYYPAQKLAQLMPRRATWAHGIERRCTG